MITTGSFTGSFSFGRAVAIAPPPPSGMTLIYDTTLAPTSEIQLPLRGIVNVLIDWGDGNTETVNTVGDKSHTYATSGTYTVTITGTLTHFGLDNWYDSIVNPESLTAVTSWDGLGLISLSSAFKGTENLATVPATLPATVTDLSYLFNQSWYFNDPNVSSWDVSNVTNFEATFLNTDVFDQPLNSWNVSNAVTMELMFCAALSFNQPLDNWDVSNVTNMSDMFGSAEKFNQNIDNWNVSNVTNMYSMFAYAYDYNQPLNSWDVSNVTDMIGLFTGTKAFNQPLDNWVINPANTNFAFMFSYTESFNNSINAWNVSNVTNMYAMFGNSLAFNQPIGSWNVSSVIDMGGMFRDAVAFNQSLNSWTTSSLFATPGMFWGATAYNQPMDNWDVSGIPQAQMVNMFRNASSFNQNLTDWCVSLVPFEPSNFSTGSPLTAPNKPIWGTCPVPMTLVYDTTLSPTTEIQLPLYGTTNVVVNWGDGNSETFTTSGNKSHTYATNGTYTVTISGTLTTFGYYGLTNPTSLTAVTSWGNLGTTSFYEAFAQCSNLTSVPSTAPPNAVILDYMFDECSNFNQNINSWDVSGVTSMIGVFYYATSFNQPLNNWNTASVTDMSYMFYKAVNFNGSIGNWNTANVTNMSYMFAENLTVMAFNQPIGSWNVSSVTNMEEMFRGCESFNQPLNSWNVGSVTNMISMFEGATSFNQPLSNWNVSLVTSMNQMFAVAIAFNQDISAWNVSSVTDMSHMFSSAENFNQPLNNWNVSNVTRMDAMFSNCTVFNQPLNNWNVSNVTDMSAMFLHCTVFNQPLNNWNVSNVTTMQAMFVNASVFNQNISSWCVTLIPSEPINFSTGSPLTAPNKPVWGTCPANCDPYFTSVSVLLHMNGPDGSTTFTDSSSNNFSVSGVNGATISTSESKFGSGSLLSTGGLSGSYITLPTDSKFQLRDADSWTIECWVYSPTGFTPCVWTGGDPNEIIITGIGRSNVLYAPATWDPGGDIIVNQSSIPVSANTWTHIALVSVTGGGQLFVNGTSGAITGPINTDIKYIGGNGGIISSTGFNGYIDDFRVTKGVARYTTNFTPPTAQFPDIPCPDPYFNDVSLLLHLNGPNLGTTITDSSNNHLTESVNNGVNTSTSNSKFNGSSLYIPRTGYFAYANNAAFVFGTNDFTLEFWVYSTQSYGSIYDGRPFLTNGNYFAMGFTALTMVLTANGSTLITSDTPFAQDSWVFFAVSRSGTTTRLFQNGIQVGSATDTTNYINGATGDRPIIGRNGFDTTYNLGWFQGWLAEFRITLGVARYTSNFTPPTQPFPNS